MAPPQNADDFVANEEHVCKINVTKGQRILSERFECDGYDWQLLILPCGNERDHAADGTHIGVFLCVPRVEDTKPQPREVRFRLQLVGKDPDDKRYQKGARYTFNGEEGDWGFARLAPRNIVHDPKNGYLEDGCLTVRLGLCAKSRCTTQPEQLETCEDQKQGSKNPTAATAKRSSVDLLKSIHEMKAQSSEDQDKIAHLQRELNSALKDSAKNATDAAFYRAQLHNELDVIARLKQEHKAALLKLDTDAKAKETPETAQQPEEIDAAHKSSTAGTISVEMESLRAGLQQKDEKCNKAEQERDEALQLTSKYVAALEASTALVSSEQAQRQKLQEDLRSAEAAILELQALLEAERRMTDGMQQSRKCSTNQPPAGIKIGNFIAMPTSKDNDDLPDWTLLPRESVEATEGN